MRKPRPHQIVFAIGVLFAVFTIASGIMPTLTHWHDDSPIERRGVHQHPDRAQGRVLRVGIGDVARRRVARVAAGPRTTSAVRPTTAAPSKKNAKRRFADFRAGVWMQTLLRDPAAGIMHSCIYFGFIGLFIVTVVLRDRPPAARLAEVPARPGLRGLLGVRRRLAGVVFLVGIGWAIVRRYVQRPYRIRIKTKPEDAVILGTFLLIGLTGFFTEGARIALLGRPAFEKWSFIGYPLSSLVKTWSPHTLSNAHRWLWAIHVVAFLAFLAILPITKLRHMFTSPMNMYLQRSRTARRAR